MNQNPEPAPNAGSPGFRGGFGWAWATAVGATMLATLLGVLIDELVPSGDRGMLAGMLPPFALLGLLAWAFFTGRRAMATGVLAALGSMFAVLLLGVAACFGLVGLGGF